MNFYIGARPLLKNKIRSGVSFFNFFLSSNSFDINFFINFINMNFNNKFFFFNSFSHFNLGNFYRPIHCHYDLKGTILFNLNFLDFVNLHKFFLEEGSTFNNYMAGTWRACSIYRNNTFNIFFNFKKFFLSGFGASNLFSFLFNKIKNVRSYFFLLYSLFFNFFFFLIYFLK